MGTQCANILLDTAVGRENVKLSDFGCSRKIAGTELLNNISDVLVDTLAQAQPKSIRGTPFWMVAVDCFLH